MTHVALPAFPQPVLSERFRPLSLLGEGATGAVYEVYDTRLEQSVAAKTIRSADANSLYRLKKEFRTLCDLRHPNLVRLYELFGAERSCFFTMELISGSHFGEYLRGRSRHAGSPNVPNRERLRDVLLQLGAALGYLHAQGKVHRDIKPGNVLVERTGRVVLVDFGLTTDLSSDLSARSRAGGLAGTFAYMSPEQARGDELTTASDWYSLGTMLFEAVTGELPFPANNFHDLLVRPTLPVPSARELAPDVPDEIDDLLRGLLDPRPEARPGAADVAQRCAAWSPDPVKRPVAFRKAPCFVGREAELALLRAALDESRAGPALVEVVGPSGIGKTALVDQLARRVAGDGVTLRSRCHPRETIPFKSIDGVVDDLSRVLSQARRDELQRFLPRHPASLLMAFPVMGRIAELAKSASPLPRERPDVRRQALASLRELLEKLSDRQPVVVWIDDAQWGDEDGNAALADILRPPDAPRVLVVVSQRPGHAGDGLPDLVRALRQHGLPHRRIELAPLSDAELGEIVRAETRAAAHAEDEQLAGVVREARGSPFLAIELARALAERKPQADLAGAPSLLSALVAARVQPLPPRQRSLLDLLAVAGHPVAESVLTGPLRQSLSDVWQLIETRLLAPSPGAAGLSVSLEHDALAESLLAFLGDDEKRTLHRTLAEAFEDAPGRYDDGIVDHWIAAGEPERAADSAVALAGGASAAGAFGMAAAHYRKALEISTSKQPRWLLMRQLAGVLTDAGRTSDAASVFEAAADEVHEAAPDDWQRVALRRLAAGAHVRSGSYPAGCRALTAAGREVDVAFPKSRARALLRAGWVRARIALRDGLGRSRLPAQRPSARQRERLELCWEAAQALRFVDMPRAMAYQAQHALLARELGDPRHLSRSLGLDAMFRAWRLGDEDWQRTESLLLEAERMALETHDPLIAAHGKLMRAVTLAIVTRFSEALELAEEAEAYCRSECRGARWELATLHQTILLATAMQGELARVGRLMERFLREARDSGDEFACSTLPIGIPNLAWLGAGDPDEAERQLERAIGPSFAQESLWTLYHGEYARVHIDLYRADGRGGRLRVEKLRRRLARAGFLRSPTIRINVHDLRARCALLEAEREASGSKARGELLGLAAEDVRKMRAEKAGWADPMITRLEGQLHALRGEREAARLALGRAALGLQHRRLGLLAAAARHRLAALSDDGGAREAREEALRWMTEHGVADPERMLPLC